ncbi:hypothetical protein B0H66DRAFT_550034 [Apodospora peruviana]|uniref:AA1-like domain-containing protein n=1 Tax=Apodospora peruviana TaxID=516989 RepID=A0AAE0IJ20_9PEZI|nr:hypothetical protein B0H66DRAFT_550034 [Apodospora peruviana]
MYTFLLSLLLPALAVASPLSLSKSNHQRDDNGAGCTSNSQHGFAWQITGFDYHASYIFTTPAHQNSWGYVNFNITNPAVPGVAATCSGTSNQLSDFFYGTMPYTCTTPDDSSLPRKTTFDFSRPSGLLRINETWSCADQDPQYPTTFTGYGAVNVKLNCTDVTHINSNWTIGQIYSNRLVNCAPVDLALKPYAMTAIA